MKKRVIAVLGILLLSSALVFGCSGKNDTQDTDAKEQVEETDQKEDVDTESSSEADAGIEDGTYSADFNTDSGMFHANEACEGKGTLTVKDGKMTIHVSLVSKNILNLYPGLAEDAQKDGAELLEPTEDTVTYSDGTTEEVYGFDIITKSVFPIQNRLKVSKTKNDFEAVKYWTIWNFILIRLLNRESILFKRKRARTASS